MYTPCASSAILTQFLSISDKQSTMRALQVLLLLILACVSLDTVTAGSVLRKHKKHKNHNKPHIDIKANVNIPVPHVDIPSPPPPTSLAMKAKINIPNIQAKINIPAVTIPNVNVVERVKQFAVNQATKLTTTPAASRPSSSSTQIKLGSGVVTDAPVGTQIQDLQKFSAKKLSEVIPSGIGAQLPGDRENNEAAIKKTKFDLRWAKSIKQKHLDEGEALVPKTDKVNEDFLDFQAQATRQPLIKPSLFNS